MNLHERIPSLKFIKAEKGDSWVTLPVDKLIEASYLLRDEFGFDCLSSLTGTDKGGSFEVVYHLYSYSSQDKLTLKINLTEAKPNCPSVASIWPSADWMERETFDLLGIKFLGHPNLKRILLPEDWEGYPLRKDYKEGEYYWSMETKR